MDNICIIDREGSWFERRVEEVVYIVIWMFHPDLNRDCEDSAIPLMQPKRFG